MDVLDKVARRRGPGRRDRRAIEADQPAGSRASRSRKAERDERRGHAGHDPRLVPSSGALRAGRGLRRRPSIFAPDVLGFGTHGAILEGLDELASGQWQHVWPNIQGFTFDVDRLHCGVDGDLAWAICL